jgi:hypothetical protein
VAKRPKAKKASNRMKFRKRRGKVNIIEFSEKNVLVCKVHKNGSSANKRIEINTNTTENS